MRTFIKSFLLLFVFLCSQSVLSAVSQITADDFLRVIKETTNVFANGHLKNKPCWSEYSK